MLILIPTSDDGVVHVHTKPCRSCAAPIMFGFTLAGRAIPVNPQRAPDGNLRAVGLHASGAPVFEVADDGEWVSHFATCPKADTHRNRNRNRR